MKTKIFSFFAGAGFLDFGFESAGHDVVYVNEYHEPFLAAYKHARRKLAIDEPEYGYYSGSITDFLEPKYAVRLKEMMQNGTRTGAYTGFIGGPPCPDFSVGGKNKGRDGERGKLSRSYIELICNQKPDFFLFENVKGLWQTKRHREFYDELKCSLHQAGYVMDERLINSIEYGVAQDRDRILLIGFHKRLFGNSTNVQDALSISLPWLNYARYTKKEVFSYNWIGTTPFEEDSYIHCPTGTPEELTVQYWFKENRVLDHPNTEHCFKPRNGLVRFQSVPEGDSSKKSFKRLHRWRYSPTVAYGNNEVHLHPYKPRRISVSEALALQSLPSTFELPSEMTLSNMFKTIGNGVPYLAARAIAQTVKDFLENAHDYDNSIGYYQSNSQITKKPCLQLY